jgi:4-amino-4-deoxy-L-arabinose transferase-like glycosyltransferase
MESDSRATSHPRESVDSPREMSAHTGVSRMNVIHRHSIAALAGKDSRLSALALIAVLGLGLSLRLVDIDRPFYGYHMWNEAYYATIARNFNHFGLLNSYNYDWRGGSELGQRHGPSPFVPWLVHFSSHLFGESEAAARLPILFLGMLSLLAIYFIARELYDAQIALIASFLAAIMPGVVFMSRQLALDSPMVAFGLASVWTLLRARRKPRGSGIWIAVSSLCLGIAVFAKYTGVLFVPLLGFIWLRSMKQGGSSREPFRWLLPAAYFLAASLPAVAWLTKGWLASSGAGGGGDFLAVYLVRSNEWRLTSWMRAFYTTWVRTGQQVGQLLWYPFVLTVVLSLTSRRSLGFIKQNVEVLLLILPWFAVMIYPVSWYQNDSYSYPALYGIAVLLALIIRRAAHVVQELLRPSYQKMLMGITLLITVVVVGVLADYVQYYGSWYRDFSSSWALQLPANLITQKEPFASARMVRSLNTSHAPILADTPATLYYAQDEYWQGKATWYWWTMPGELGLLLKAIESLKYAYVVFTYQPPSVVVSVLGETGYDHVGLGVWQRTSTP